jgi:hypothetical protein
MLYALAAPTFTAYCHILVITTYLHLGAFSDNIALAVYTCIDYRLAPASASRFDLIYTVGYLKETTAPLEEA